MKIISASSRNHSLPHFLSVALLLAALMNCGAIPEAAAAASAPHDDVQLLLDKAHASAMDARAPYLLDAANLALQQNQGKTAERILQEISELKLRDDQRARNSVLRAQLLLLQGKADAALTLLQSRELQQDSTQLSAREQNEISLLRARAFAENGKYFASAQERIFVAPLLKEREAEQNNQEIQRALMQASTAELQQQRDKATNQSMQGWLDLALSAKRNQSAQRADGIQKSLAQPANAAPSIGHAPATQQIALLLPQSGKFASFGDAVRDGFFAAWFQAKQRGEKLPAVRIYDTESAGVVALYQQAIADGAGLVIGPLEKNLVAQFYTQTLAVPLLALNRADTTQPPPANLFQLALAPEDETAQIAVLAAKAKHLNALIIATEEESRSRELEAFTQRWQSQGGKIAATVLYRDQQSLSTAIRSALNIPRSEARAKEMEGILNRNIESVPHRRRDIDMVFMLAKPAQARLIKPLLDFYYAGDLPIYSTSRIYAGYPLANADRDAEKVRFTEIPWILQQSTLKQQILSARPTSKNFLRLYALGIDSFNFYPRLRQQELNGDLLFNGQTGGLSLDSQRIVQRTLPLAEMRAGTPRLIDGNGIMTEISDTGRDGNVDQQINSSP